MKARRDREPRFWEKIDQRGPDDCWLWLASDNGSGYGRYRIDGRNYGAHRLAYELEHGPIPEGESHHDHCVLHRCDVPLCCNPKHLFLGSQKENVEDQHRKGRAASFKGEANGSAKLTDRDIEGIRSLSPSHTHREIGKRYGVSHTTVGYILRGRNWSHV